MCTTSVSYTHLDVYKRQRYRTRFSLMMAVDNTAETSGFAENIGSRLNSPGRNFNNKQMCIRDRACRNEVTNFLEKF